MACRAADVGGAGTFSAAARNRSRGQRDTAGTLSQTGCRRHTHGPPQQTYTHTSTAATLPSGRLPLKSPSSTPCATTTGFSAAADISTRLGFLRPHRQRAARGNADDPVGHETRGLPQIPKLDCLAKASRNVVPSLTCPRLTTHHLMREGSHSTGIALWKQTHSWDPMMLTNSLENSLNAMSEAAYQLQQPN